MPPGRSRERREELVGPHAQLLADDRAPPPRRPASRAARADRPGSAGRSRDQLCDEPVPGGARQRPAQLLARGPSARAASGRRSPTRRTGRRDGTRGSSKRRAGSRRRLAERGRRCRPCPSRRRSGVDLATPSPQRASAGSRSSSVVVVTKACGSVRDAPDEVGPAGRDPAREKTSSRRRSGGRPSSAVRRSSSASLRARIAVRCWPRDAKEARSRLSSANARSSRWGPTSVVPFQSSFSAVSREPPGQRVAGVSPAVGAALLTYATSRRIPSSGAISAWAAASGAGELARAARWRASSDAPPRPRGASRPRRGSWSRARLLLADRPQERGCAAPARARRWRGRRRRPGSAAAASASRAARRSDGGPDDEQHLLGREDDTPQDAGQRRRSARHPVDADPLPSPGGPLADQRHVQRPAAGDAGRSRRPSTRAKGAVPADHLGVGPGPVRATRGRAGRCASRRLVLPAALGPQTRWGPGPNVAVERIVRAEPGEARARSSRVVPGRGARPPGSALGGRPDRHHDVRVVTSVGRPEDARRERPVQLDRRSGRRRRSGGRRPGTGR